jgi:hypothetical protein
MPARPRVPGYPRAPGRLPSQRSSGGAAGTVYDEDIHTERTKQHVTDVTLTPENWRAARDSLGRGAPTILLGTSTAALDRAAAQLERVSSGDETPKRPAPRVGVPLILTLVAVASLVAMGGYLFLGNTAQAHSVAVAAGGLMVVSAAALELARKFPWWLRFLARFEKSDRAAAEIFNRLRRMR